MANAHTDKQALVRRKIKGCTKCSLHSTCSAPVPAAFGSPNTPYLVIGEGPGFSEDQKGVPFVGKSGNYLRETLKRKNIPPKLVSYCNLVSCRPPDNRNPHKTEVDKCAGNLRLQLHTANPTIIFILGAQALNFFRPDMTVSWDRGRPWVDYKRKRIFIPTFHPSYILRQKKAAPMFEEDIAQGRGRFKLFVGGGLLDAMVEWPETCHRPNCLEPVDYYDSMGVAYCSYHRDGGDRKKAEELMLEGVI